MKKIWRLAFVGFAITAFTACGNGENTTETETTEQVETDMDMEMEGDLEMETDTTVVQDTTINDGVADDIPDEQPPIE